MSNITDVLTEAHWFISALFGRICVPGDFSFPLCSVICPMLPMSRVSPVLSSKICVVDFVLLHVFTFLVPLCVVRYDLHQEHGSHQEKE